MEKIIVIFKGCLTSLHKRRLEEDAAKRILSIGSYYSPSVLGRFLCSETFEDAVREVERCERSAERCTVGAFLSIRNVLMLNWNAANVVVVVDGGRLLTRRPYRVCRDISNAFFCSSV